MRNEDGHAKAYIDKEAKLIEGKFLVVRQDIVAKLDQGVVVAPNYLLHLKQMLVRKAFKNIETATFFQLIRMSKLKTDRGCIEDLLLENLEHRAEGVLDKRSRS